MSMDEYKASVIYAGFWSRVFASVLDSIIQLLILFPLVYFIFGSTPFVSQSFDLGSSGYLIDFVTIVLIILFWKYRSATPGKMMMGIKIVDADTLGEVPLGRLILRFFGYIVSMLPFCLGFFWIAVDKRKQGFHDKIANTLVIHKPVTK